MNLFFEISLILALAAAVAFVMQWLRLPLLLGHIITGILAGPAVLQIIHGKETVEVFSQLGITALLFVVGLSLNPTVVREVGKIALLTGIGQIVFTTIFGFAISFLLGYPWITSLFLAVALTFSSTIIIMKLLSDRGDEQKLYGKISIGFLLVQDLVATMLLIFISTLTKENGLGGTLVLTLGKTAAILFLLFLVGKYILPHLSKIFSQSQEFLFLFSIGWGVGMAAFFHAVGLSIEIGALAAGVVLASSPYRFEITAKMRLLRDFFIIMFFVLLGSQLTWSNVGAQIPHALLLSIFILIGKPLIIIAIMSWMNYSKKTAFFAGLTVAQISEFSLLLILLVAQKDYVPADTVSLVTMIGIITISTSTVMILKADALYTICSPWLSFFERRHPIKEKTQQEAYRAFIFGCNRIGMEFIPFLTKKRLNYLAIDFNPAVVERLKERGIPCRYGDAYDSEFLDELRLESCKILVSTIADMDINLLLLEKLRKANPEAMAIVSASTLQQAECLYAAQASYVILPHFLGGNHTAMLLETHGLKKSKFDMERKRHMKYLNDRLTCPV